MRQLFTDLRADLAGARTHIGVAAVLLLVAGVWGGVDTGTGAAILESFKEIAQGLAGKPILALTLAIFVRNSLAGALAIVGGTFFGLLPLAGILFNGLLIGAVIRLYPGEAWRIIPHGIFELPAMIVCWGFGLWTGQALMERSALPPLRERLRRGMRIYFRLVLPLLALAAVIEGTAAYLILR